MIAQQFRNMLRGVAELTTTQFEELRATMDRMRTQDMHCPSMRKGYGGKSAIVNKVVALPRSGQTRGIGIPGRSHFLSPTNSTPAEKESSSFVTALSSADWSLPATANETQKANAFAAVVKVEMADDATVVAKTHRSGAAQHSSAVADQGAFTEQQLTVLVLLLEGLPNQVVAQRLVMSERAVKDHVNAILGRLGVTSRKQAISIVRRQRMAEVLAYKRSRTDPGARLHNGLPRQPGTIPSAPSAGLGLTQRQESVLNLLLEGLPNKVIARRLGLTVNTVKEHVSAILLRLDLRSRAEVISRMNPHVEAARTGYGVSLATTASQDGTIEVAQRAPTTAEALGLTQRQGSVLILLLEGLPNKIIARRLGLTENTVKEHVSGILQRLEVRTRTEAMSRLKPLHVRQMATDGAP